MSRLLFFTSAISVLLFLIVLFSVRRSHIRSEYSVGWLIASAALFGLSRSEWLLEKTARVLHIEQPPVVLLLFVAGVFLILFFWASILISRLRDDTIALVQRIAILEFHVQQLQPTSLIPNDGQTGKNR
jgi:hypothetical protein